jgi:hypothetical protein
MVSVMLWLQYEYYVTYLEIVPIHWMYMLVMKRYKAIESSFMYIKPGNYSDPRKIVLVIQHYC